MAATLEDLIADLEARVNRLEQPAATPDTNLADRVSALEAWVQIPAQHIPGQVKPDPLDDLKKVFPAGQPYQAE